MTVGALLLRALSQTVVRCELPLTDILNEFFKCFGNQLVQPVISTICTHTTIGILFAGLYYCQTCAVSVRLAICRFGPQKSDLRFAVPYRICRFLPKKCGNGHAYLSGAQDGLRPDLRGCKKTPELLNLLSRAASSERRTSPVPFIRGFNRPSNLVVY